MDTATALKGVLEGLALDGRATRTITQTCPTARSPLRCFGISAARVVDASPEARAVPARCLLADDQGLGKTFSAIALIVSNRPAEMVRAARGAEDRPAGGTLVVCPTSVLRQWQRELASKVSSSAGLRVLVHHGVGRTKSSVDLAAYDVVLTTLPSSVWR